MNESHATHDVTSRHLGSIYADDSIFEPKVEGPLDAFQEWVINLTVSGNCRFEFGGRRVLLKAGDLLIARPGVTLQWRVPEGKAAWHTVHGAFHPRAHWMDWLRFAQHESGVVVSLPEPAREQTRSGLLEVVQVYRSGRPYRDDFALLELERVLLTLHTHLGPRAEALDSRVRLAVELLHARYSEAWSIPRLAAEACISPSRLTGLFRAHMESSPMAYLERVRMEHAEKLLRFGLDSVADVARAVGFTDPEHFATRFRRFCGQTPRQFRRRGR